MKLGRDEILCINALENVSRVQAKDCIIKEKTITYVVPHADMGKAIGKNGALIKRLSENLSKHVEIIPFYDSAEGFVKNFFKEAKIGKVDVRKDENGRENASMVTDSEGKRKILHNPGKWKKMKEILERSYNIYGARIISE